MILDFTHPLIFAPAHAFPFSFKVQIEPDSNLLLFLFYFSICQTFVQELMFGFVLFCDWNKVRKIEPTIPLGIYRRYAATLYKTLSLNYLEIR